jgi:hypothetical protein
MAQVSGQGTIWNLPNFWGELFTADPITTPFLSMIGGLTGGGLQADNFEFPTSSEYDFPAETQPEITETASLTAPTATEAIRNQVKNVTQIYQQAVAMSYVKLSNQGRLSGINSVGASNNVSDSLAFQIDYNLKIIARNVEETMLNGTFQISTSAGVANKSRGMMAVCDLTGGTANAASSAALSKALFEAFIQDMFDNGALFVNPVLWANSFQIMQLSNLYAFEPTDRKIAGANITEIITPLATISIAPAHKFMDTDSLLIADMSVINPVTQPVPGMGNMFYETLSKTGASENGQIFGQVGLEHGPAFAHGKLTGLSTS